MTRAEKKFILWPLLFIIWSLNLQPTANATDFSSSSNETAARIFTADGVIEKISSTEKIATIRHGAISNFMGAMIMPFHVRDAKIFSEFQPGDQIHFQLHVNATESWVDNFVKFGTGSLPENKIAAKKIAALPQNALLDFPFTNELSQPVRLNDFRGQALALTFFYTRCPLPDFCPRLSKNFSEASQKLKSLTNAPANWHFISVSFDPDVDSPARLKIYGQSYDYNPAHWSFLTGPPEKIAELAQQCGVKYKSDDGAINHNFRTLIIDAAGHLQMVFPTTGDLSDQIVFEMLKAAAATNQIVFKK